MTPPIVKPGIRTTQFWTHIAILAAIIVLTGLIGIQDTLPPTLKAIVAGVGVAALAWLQREYAKGRTDLYAKAMEAGAVASAAVDTPAKAVAILNAP